MSVFFLSCKFWIVYSFQILILGASVHKGDVVESSWITQGALLVESHKHQLVPHATGVFKVLT